MPVYPRMRSLSIQPRGEMSMIRRTEVPSFVSTSSLSCWYDPGLTVIQSIKCLLSGDQVAWYTSAEIRVHPLSIIAGVVEGDGADVGISVGVGLGAREAVGVWPGEGGLNGPVAIGDAIGGVPEHARARTD